MGILKILGIVSVLFGKLREAGSDGKITIDEMLDIVSGLLGVIGWDMVISMPRSGEDRYVAAIVKKDGQE